MEGIDILPVEFVLSNGIEFTGDVCYSGVYGQEVFNKPLDEGGIPISGILYERYKNGSLAYYAYYKNGMSDGDNVNYYESGKVTSFQQMSNGVISGKKITWFENGNIKSKEEYKYGFCVTYRQWSEAGELVTEKTEPSEFDKKMIEKYNKRAKKLEGK
ncbi:hypothetical protein NQ117_10260 [Paenibacillus sp. SC116]|uniref:toxin-antitoxin system YwqK family antitoxin n=1 Tax=Paenibacillus sp. SC116 TaxID=2968986 RepID=UPI00215A31C4|nr:hypothetical protein [Paenibacillus sp. SC116]MCR8844068.1 hypothetical protein [Paenibacillus sp. SC116]